MVFSVFTRLSFLLGTEVFLVPSVRSEVGKSVLLFFGLRSCNDLQVKLETLVSVI